MNVDFVTAVKMFFANYVNFCGRSTRAEYWWAVLFCILLGMVCAIFPDWVSSLVSVVLLLPNLAVSVRRLHDIGKSGKWMLLFYGLPFVFSIFIVVMAGFSIGMTIMSDSATEMAEFWLSNIALLIVYLITVIALGITYLIWMCKPSAPDNQYGLNPYGE